MSNKALKQNLSVIETSVVKKEPPDYADFDRFAKLGDKLIEALRKIEEVVEALTDRTKVPDDSRIKLAEEYLKQRPKAEKTVDQFRAAEKVYDRDELYDKRADDEQPRQISRRYVSERLTLLVGAFPNSNPHSPEVFTKMLYEEVVARNPDAITLESACRVLRRTKTFVPTIAEMLKAIQQEESLWYDRREAGGEGDYACNILDDLVHLAEVLTEAKARQKVEADRLATAYTLGRDARAKREGWGGMPAEYRNRENLCAAWQRGWDEENEVINLKGKANVAPATDR
jgi:hypothetical protein